VLRLRNRLDAHTSTVAQTLIERLVLTDPGWFDGVLDRARALYAGRAQVLVDALNTALPGAFSVIRPEGGLFLWPRLADDTIDAVALAGRAAEQGVLYEQGEFFASGADARESSRHLRLAATARRRSFGRRSAGWPRRSDRPCRPTGAWIVLSSTDGRPERLRLRPGRFPPCGHHRQCRGGHLVRPRVDLVLRLQP
jgi:hypothetical protein